MKKIALFLTCFAVGICVMFYSLYRMDLARMANNEPVIFSTWGYDYAGAETDSDANNNSLTMSPMDGTLTSRGMVVTIVNNSDNTIYFGDYFAIEKKQGSRWNEISYVSSASPDWSDATYVIGAGSSMDFSYYWVDLYGELDKGEYRMVKLYYDNTSYSEIARFYCEFEIE